MIKIDIKRLRGMSYSFSDKAEFDCFVLLLKTFGEKVGTMLWQKTNDIVYYNEIDNLWILEKDYMFVTEGNNTYGRIRFKDIPKYA